MSAQDTRACGCCEGPAQPTPEPIDNRPGLSALCYRVGTYTSFRRAMLLAIAAARVQAEGKTWQPLAGWTTRDSDDFGIALMSLWATVCDILTFYQERTANEAYLRTATLRDSLLRLAALLDYRPAPGVAASAYLAFTLQNEASVQIPTGLAVQSVPGQDEKPQKFETVEARPARLAWNVLKPQQRTAPRFEYGVNELYVQGLVTDVKPGDAILLVGDERAKRWYGSEKWDFRTVQTVEQHPAEDESLSYTRLTWVAGLGHRNVSVDPADNPRAYVFRQRAALFGYSAPDWHILLDDLKKVFLKQANQIHKEETGSGNNKYDLDIPDTWPDNWPTELYRIRTVEEALLDLDAVYPKILQNSWIVLAKPTYEELYRAVEVATGARTDFTLTGKTTRIKIDIREHLRIFGLRDTVVFAQSEELALAQRPLRTPVFGDTVVLDALVPDMDRDRPVIVSGRAVRWLQVAGRTRVVRRGHQEIVETDPPLPLLDDEGDPVTDARAKAVTLDGGDVLALVGAPVPAVGGKITWQVTDAAGHSGYVTALPDEIVPVAPDEEDPVVSEVALISSTDVLIAAANAGGTTTLTFQSALKHTYHRSTVVIYGNVLLATHGETVSGEVLGSGDAATAFQAFELKKTPVTFVPQPGAPGGAASTLRLRVNDVLWHEVPTLYGQAGDARAYKTTIDDDSVMTVRTGDNRTGARPPTGRNNVVATYRKGLGRDGNVRANTLKTLLDSLKGVKRVINPLAAEGGTEPESAASLRANLPNTVRTFGRIVSLRDFEDAAREFIGVAKARAAWVWDGEEQVVQLTVAGDEGATIEPGGTTHTNLVADLNSRRDPHRRLVVNSYERVPVVVAAHVLVNPDYLPDIVQADVLAAVEDLLDFENVDLGETIYASDLLRVTQQVDGIVAVDLVEFHELSGSPSGKDVADYVLIGPHQLVAIDDPSEQVTITTEVKAS